MGSPTIRIQWFALRKLRPTTRIIRPTQVIRLLRKWRNTSAPIAEITSTVASSYVQGLVKKGQFGVFQLPSGRAFAQVMRIETGGLRIEVSARSDRLEKLLEPVGTVSINDLGFLTVVSQPGADDMVGQVIAASLAELAAVYGCDNITRAQTGRQ